MRHRRELLNVKKHLAQRNNEFGSGVYGLYVKWHTYSQEESKLHTVYGEGLEKIYKTPLKVKCLWLTVSDQENVMNPEARAAIKHLNGAVTVDSLRNAGMLEPLSVSDRLNDVIEYKGDRYNVLTFDPSGHLGYRHSEHSFTFLAVHRRHRDNPLDEEFYKQEDPPWS